MQPPAITQKIYESVRLFLFGTLGFLQSWQQKMSVKENNEDIKKPDFVSKHFQQTKFWSWSVF